jgi:hypothetical protein
MQSLGRKTYLRMVSNRISLLRPSRKRVSIVVTESSERSNSITRSELRQLFQDKTPIISIPFAGITVTYTYLLQPYREQQWPSA